MMLRMSNKFGQFGIWNIIYNDMKLSKAANAHSLEVATSTGFVNEMCLFIAKVLAVTVILFQWVMDSFSTSHNINMFISLH